MRRRNIQNEKNGFRIPLATDNIHFFVIILFQC